MKVYVEVGRKRVFAGAIAWPGWTRAGRSEEEALEALVIAGGRYREVAVAADERFAPVAAGELEVVERIEGDASTDFGAPGRIPAADREPLGDAELRRQRALLRACWSTFDAVTERARGVELRKGPRGGGRELAGIVEHVVAAEVSYLSSLTAWNAEAGSGAVDGWPRTRERELQAIGEFRAAEPRTTPRGRVLWPPRYFVRRAAWHVLDHAWEVEDRMG